MSASILMFVSYGERYLYLIPYMAQLLISVIGLWKVFEKAGEKGWKALVPGLNLYILFRIVDEIRLFIRIAVDAAVIVGLVVTDMIAGSRWPVLDTVAGIVFFGLGLIIMIRLIILNSRLAESFGLGVIWFVAMVLLPGISYLIIGFSKNIKYLGPDPEPVEERNGEPEASRFTNPYTSYRDF